MQTRLLEPGDPLVATRPHGRSYSTTQGNSRSSLTPTSIQEASASYSPSGISTPISSPRETYWC
jgi:hypothetical protein